MLKLRYLSEWWGSSPIWFSDWKLFEVLQAQAAETGENLAAATCLRTCSKSLWQKSQERKVDELQAGVEPALAVFSQSPVLLQPCKAALDNPTLWHDLEGVQLTALCDFLIHVHLVFVTKYRRGVFTKEVIDDLSAIFASVCKDFDVELMEFDGKDDHVHLLVNYPPKVSVSALVNSLKGVSSRMIRQKNYPSVAKKLWGAALWSPSYFAGSCGGASIAVIRQYIEQQQTPHQPQ